MSMSGYQPGPTRAPVAARGRPSLGTLGTVLAVGAFLLVIVVSLFGDASDGEPKQILRLDRAAPAGDASLAAGGSAPALAGELLVAANGIVISDPALMEGAAEGALPRIADDGRKPSQVYARPFDAGDPRPKIAIVVGGLGLGEAVTQAAIDRLPVAVTLAFTPYGSSLQSLVSAARAKGHEVLIEVPMEPYDYPNNDPGQNTLLTGAQAGENPARLRWVMSRVAGYAGLINSQGAKYLSSQEDVQFIVGEANKRGLYLIDSGESDQSVAREVATASGAAFARGDQQIDRDMRREAIEREFAALETLAKQRGAAIGVTTALPVTTDRILAWAEGLEQRGIVLAPVSAIIASAPLAAAPAPSGGPRSPPRRAQRPPAASQLPSDPKPAFEEPTAAPHP